MANYTLPYFGELDLDNLEDYYNTECELNGSTISIDLNFDSTTVTPERMADIKTILESLKTYDSQNAGYMAKDLKEGNGETSEYLEFYLDEFDDEELSTIIDIDQDSSTFKPQLLEKLQLFRVGLYPDSKYSVAYFDYSIAYDGEPCNQLLVVKTNEKGALDNIVWES